MALPRRRFSHGLEIKGDPGAKGTGHFWRRSSLCGVLALGRFRVKSPWGVTSGMPSTVGREPSWSSPSSGLLET